MELSQNIQPQRIARYWQKIKNTKLNVWSIWSHKICKTLKNRNSISISKVFLSISYYSGRKTSTVNKPYVFFYFLVALLI